jgi:HD-like signal output (HDOD) protein
MSDAHATLAAIVQRAGHLYTLPRVAMEVLKLTENPKTDAGLLKKCIENDPALTARLLRIVNSSLFGLPREVSDLSQALALLGIKPLKLLVLGFSLPDALFAGLAGDVLERYWQQSLCKAVAAREIATVFWRTAGDEAFIAGLLQDLGLLVLVQDAGTAFVDLWRRVQQSHVDLLQAERRVLGFDHAELSAQLLETWQLPPRIVRAVAGRSVSGTSTGQPAEPLDAVVHLAGLVTQLVVDGHSRAWPDLLAAGAQYRSIAAEQWSELITGLQAHVEQLAEILHLKLPDADYRRLLEQAREQLVACATDAALELVRARQHGYDCELETLLALEEVRRLHAQLEARSGCAAPMQRAAAHAPSAAAPLAGQLAAAWHGEAALPPGREEDGPEPSTGGGFAAPGGPPLGQVVGSDEPDPGGGNHGPQSSRAPVATARGGEWCLAEHSARWRQPWLPAARSADEMDALRGVLLEQGIACRWARQSLSLLLLELHSAVRSGDCREAHHSSELCELLGTLCRRIDHPGARCMPLGAARLGVVLPDCDRREAVEHAHAATAAFRRWLASNQIDTTLAVAGGVASLVLPPPNFQPHELLDSAARCLHAARHAGTDCVKSIEVY